MECLVCNEYENVGNSYKMRCNQNREKKSIYIEGKELLLYYFGDLPCVDDLWRQPQMLHVRLNLLCYTHNRPHAQYCYFDENPCCTFCHWRPATTLVKQPNPSRSKLNRTKTCFNSKYVQQKWLLLFFCCFLFVYYQMQLITDIGNTKSPSSRRTKQKEKKTNNITLTLS